MRRLTRLSPNATAEQRSAFAQEFNALLNELGVAPGDDFGVCAVIALGENSVGPSHGAATSRKAALDNYPRSGSQRHRILLALRNRGMTREEIEFALQLSGNAVRPRVDELMKGGWVEATDRTRKTTLGSDAEVLVATTKGLDAMASEDAGHTGPETPPAAVETPSKPGSDRLTAPEPAGPQEAFSDALFSVPPTKPHSAVGGI